MNVNFDNIFIFSNNYSLLVTSVFITLHVAQFLAVDLMHVTHTLILSSPIHKTK